MLKDRALVIPDIFKCIYDNVLPFNLVRNSLFVQMLNFFAKYERGLKPPTYHELRVSYLKNAIVNIQASLNKYKVKWDKWGYRCVMVGQMKNGDFLPTFWWIVQVEQFS